MTNPTIQHSLSTFLLPALLLLLRWTIWQDSIFPNLSSFSFVVYILPMDQSEETGEIEIFFKKIIPSLKNSMSARKPIALPSILFPRMNFFRYKCSTNPLCVSITGIYFKGLWKFSYQSRGEELAHLLFTLCEIPSKHAEEISLQCISSPSLHYRLFILEVMNGTESSGSGFSDIFHSAVIWLWNFFFFFFFKS